MDLKILAVGALETNCYILSLEGRKDAVVIDPGEEGTRIREALDGRRVAAVLLTHGHYDHTGALDFFDGAPLYLHPADSDLLENPAAGGGMPDGLCARPGSVFYIMEGHVITAAGIDITVLHTPGHTPGSVCYRVEDVLFTGDTLFHNGYGRTDFPGGSFSEIMRSLRRLLKMPGHIVIYPGHGQSSTLAREHGIA
jgi:hydroxyacylglutathione hydrolase